MYRRCGSCLLSCFLKWCPASETRNPAKRQVVITNKYAGTDKFFQNIFGILLSHGLNTDVLAARASVTVDDRHHGPHQRDAGPDCLAGDLDAQN